MSDDSEPDPSGSKCAEDFGLTLSRFAHGATRGLLIEQSLDEVGDQVVGGHAHRFG